MLRNTPEASTARKWQNWDLNQSWGSDRDRGGGESEGGVEGEEERDLATPRLCCAVSFLPSVVKSRVDGRDPQDCMHRVGFGFLRSCCELLARWHLCLVYL